MLLGVLALMPLSAGVALAADLAGDYAAQGADADGHSYKGVVRIQSLGSVAQAVLWRLEYGDGPHDFVHGGAILPESLEWLWRKG